MLIALLVAASLHGVTAQSLIAEVAEQSRKNATLRAQRNLVGTKQETLTDTAATPERTLETKTFRLTATADGLRQMLTVLNGASAPSSQPELPKHDVDSLVANMQEHYELVMASPGPTDGYYAIAFTPKNPDRPAMDQKGEVINRMRGIIYIDKDRKFVRRITAWLPDGFSKKLIGKVKEANAQLDQEFVDGMAVPKKTEFTVRFSRSLGINVLGMTPDTAQRTVIEYDFEPLPVIPPVNAPAPSP